MRLFFNILFLSFNSIVFSQKIVGWEYFVDEDPGIGQGVYSVFDTPLDSVSQEFEILNFNSLPAGYHFIGVRVKDEFNVWSSYLFRSFIIADSSKISLNDTTVYDIVGYEYFFDLDPGVGNGFYTSINVPKDSLTQDIIIGNTDDLLAGYHKVGVRVVSENGLWSPYLFRSFIIRDTTEKNQLDTAKHSLVGFEYFIDNDPGVGNGIYSAFDETTDSISKEITINNTGNLAKGFHYVGVRTLDDVGHWSQYLFRSFIIEDTTNVISVDTVKHKITAFEYFIDEDPGVGKGILVQLNVPQDSLTQEITVTETDGLIPGVHFIGIRTLDDIGQWSPYVFRSFRIKDTTAIEVDTTINKIVGIEYFIDSDPGVGLGTFVAFDSIVDSLTQNISISETSDLSPGFHFVGVRSLDLKGEWSHYLFRSFVIKDTLKNPQIDTAIFPILGYEYFIDDVDPGVGKADYIAFSNPSVKVTEQFSLPTSDDLTLGDHSVTFRILDSVGKWSHNYTDYFEICLNPPSKPTMLKGGSVCDGGGSITYIASGSPTGNYAWYTKSSGGSPIDSSVDSFYTHTITQSEIIYVATKDIGCNSSRIPAKGLVIDVIQTPVLKNQPRCGAGPVEFIPISGAPLGGTYRWYANSTDSFPLFTGDVFVTDSIFKNTSYYVEAITKDSVCKSDNKTGVVGIIKSCISQETIFPPIPNVIFGVDNPIPLGAYALDEFGNETGQKINYKIFQGSNRAFIRNDTVFFTGVGVVQIQAFTIKDTTYTYAEAQPVGQDFNIRADAAEVDISNNGPLCENERLILSPTLIKDGVYYWKTPSGREISQRVINIYPVSILDTGRYRLVVVTPLDTLVSSAFVEVRPAAPQVYMDTLKVSNCANKSYILKGTGGDFFKYQWSLDGSFLTETDTAVFAPTQTGVYNLKALDSNSCPSSTPPVFLDLEPDTVPQITFDKTNLKLVSSPGVSYQWFINNYLIANGTQQELDLYVNGSYKVEVVNEESCVYFSKDYTIQNNNLSEFNRFGLASISINIEDLRYDRITLFPQPVDDELYITLKSFRTEYDNNFELLNVNGEVLKTGFLEKVDQDFFMQKIDVSGMASGVYFLKVNNGNYVKSEKVIIR